MRVLLFLFFTPAFAVELPKAVITDRSAFHCPIEASSRPSAEYTSLAKSCAETICKNNFGLNVNAYKRDNNLATRYRLLVEKWLKQENKTKELAQLNSAPVAPDYLLHIDISSPSDWVTQFDSLTGYLLLLPENKKKTDYDDQLRKSISRYSLVLGAADLELSLFLRKIPITVTSTRTEALFDIEETLSRMEKKSLLNELDLYSIFLNSIFWAPWIDQVTRSNFHNLYTYGILFSSTTVHSRRFLATGAHEMAHIISQFARLHPYSEVAAALNKIQNILKEQNFLNRVEYAEEDWADFFSARMTQDNLACDVLNVAIAKNNLDLIPSENDNHSSIFYRILAIEKNQTGLLPSVCEQAIQKRAQEYCN